MKLVGWFGGALSTAALGPLPHAEPGVKEAVDEFWTLGGEVGVPFLEVEEPSRCRGGLPKFIAETEAVMS